jgi:hypothetical protein
MSSQLNTILTIDGQALHGYSVSQFTDIEYDQEAVRVLIISSGEVTTYTFFVAGQTIRDAEITSMSK